jgi:hypothetical protein
VNESLDVTDLFEESLRNKNRSSVMSIKISKPDTSDRDTVEKFIREFDQRLSVSNK